MQAESGYVTSARDAVVRSVALDALVDEDVLLLKCVAKVSHAAHPLPHTVMCAV